MAKLKYKLKEIKLGDTETHSGIKSTVTSIDPETNSISWAISNVPAFDTTFHKFIQLRNYIKKLSIDKKDDPKFKEIAQKVSNNFNEFRSHLRNNYPTEYESFKSIVEDLSKTLNEESTITSNSGFTSGGEGENHTGSSPRKSTYGDYTQAGYKKVAEGPGATFGPGPSAGKEGVADNIYVKKFKYKIIGKAGAERAAKGLPAKSLNEANTDVESYLDGLNITDIDKKKFIAGRVLGFDELETKLNELLPLLQQAKHKTMDYYRQNPESFNVLYGTDLANDYVNDLIELFKD
jgi:archaellum component FlaC